MAKYLAHDGAGGSAEVQAATTGGVGDANKIPQLDANGKFPQAMMPGGVGDDTDTFQASEALAAGDNVNIWSGSGAFRIRKADAAGGKAKKAHGFVKESVSNGATGTVYFEGKNDQVTGLAPGDVYLSATTPGGITQDASAITTAGHIVQRIGYATSATAFNFEASDPITLA